MYQIFKGFVLYYRTTVVTMTTRNLFNEKPLPLKPLSKKKLKSSKTTELRCIIHYDSNRSEKKVRQLTDHSFQVIQEKKEIRRGGAS